MHNLAEIGIIFAISFAIMTFSWIYQLISKNSNIVDVCWSFGIGTVAVYTLSIYPPEGTTGLIVLLLGVLWSLRLGSHLLVNRVILSDREDSRYAQLRKERGTNYNHFMLWFIWFQAILIPLFSIPFLLVDYNYEASALQIIIGLSIAAISIIGSIIADFQLSTWIKNPDNKGKTCRVGLWNYSRHPNYFFEWLFWCSFPVLCWSFPYGYLATIVPIVELWLLIKVTGIPYTEHCSLINRTDYKEYQLTTSPFFPWFHRKVA